jgi:predicted RNA-binding Zn-ribbon protein involved in translation (DUF1610 family)
MTGDLYTQLVQSLHPEIDRTGEAHLACPECGHPSSPRNPHCSFSAHGWHCFVCGAGGGLQSLAEKLELVGDHYPLPAKPKAKPKRPPGWITKANLLVEQYESHPRRFERWMAHKPLAMQTIVDAHLGIGILPPTIGHDGTPYYPGGCSHDRLIVPVFWGSQIVALRGRRLDCDCEAKWIAAQGATIDILPLYNWQALRTNQVIFIVENMVDALLITQEKAPWVGMAIYSTSYWKPEWAQAIHQAKPEMVIVALDNDLVGNGGARRRDELLQTWQQAHNGKAPPARGVYVVNELNKTGVPAYLMDWGDAPAKTDVGNLLTQEAFL